MATLWDGEIDIDDDDGEEGGWIAGAVECLICRARCVSVRPVSAVMPLECPRCGAMAMVDEVQTIERVGKE